MHGCISFVFFLTVHALRSSFLNCFLCTNNQSFSALVSPSFETVLQDSIAYVNFLISRVKVDVCGSYQCTRVCDWDRWSDIVLYMKCLGYDGILQQKNDPPSLFANAIFFKQPLFKVVWSEHKSHAIALALHYKSTTGHDQVSTRSVQE